MNYLIKGSTLSGAKNLLDSQMHEGYFESIATDVGLLSDRSVQHSQWYDAAKAWELFNKAAIDMGSDPNGLTKACVNFGTQKDLNFLYRLIMKMGGIQRLLNTAPRLLKSSANYYHFTIMRNEQGYFEFTLSEVPVSLAEWTYHVVEGLLSGILAACGTEMKAFNKVSAKVFFYQGEHLESALFELTY